MRQSLVPVILLATVALSSSNVLPILSINHFDTEPLGFNKPYDNTFRDRLQNRNILNDVFYKISIGTSLSDRLPKVQKLPDVKFDDFDNNRGEAEYVLSKDENYNGEGYRKEQWHNYPRQLDRLHNYLYRQHRTDKRNPDPDDPDDPDNENVGVVPKTHRSNDLSTNEFLYQNDGTQRIYDTYVANTNPFLILKIRLAYLSSKLENTDMAKATDLAENESNVNENAEKKFTNEIDPSMDAAKVKREDVSESDNVEAESLDGKRTVKKRLFSLWSRLQSLNHKGHELQHRRHLHAFYGLPGGDGGGNGVLTAETRGNTLMRPPGSPLRWG